MKLRELRDQRDALAARYDALESLARDLSGTSRVRALYDGLRELRVADESVHGKLPDLRAALEAGLGEQDSARWSARFFDEIARGRARSEAAYVYGALLAEPDTLEVTHDAELDAAFESMTSTPVARSPLLTGFLDAHFASSLRAAREQLEQGLPTLGLVPSESGELRVFAEPKRILERLAADKERSSSMRAEAAHFVRDPEAETALRDALALSLADATTWRWPGSFALRAVETHDRVRAHVNADLVTQLTLEVVAEWWEVPLGHVVRSDLANRRQRLQRLLELNAPEIIVDNERRALAEQSGALDDPSLLDPEVIAESVLVRREAELAGIQRAGLSSGTYGHGYGASRAVRLIDAEIELRRAAGKERGTCVLRTDIAECFASIEHGIVLDVLQRLGVSDRWLGLIEAFLSPRIEHRGEERACTRGLPLGFTLSRVLASVMLSLVELHVRRSVSSVVVIRAVDDFALIADSAADLARAWAALVEALSALGLRPNDEKTGAIGFGCELSESLPSRSPRWGALTLAAEGWRIDDETCEGLAARARTDIEGAPSVLAAVRAYNRHLESLCIALHAGVDLGTDGEHRARARDRVLLWHDTLFAGDGIEAWLLETIRTRSELRFELPRGWLFWPITAGGLGLRDPRLLLGMMRSKSVVLPREPLDERTSRTWGAWYVARLEASEELEPNEDAMAKALVEDFIARGGELRGEAQNGLSPYWRWVLTTHGPDIVESFGTFRFLARRLVPLDIVGGSTGRR